jgi:23S rRNA pseudouridine2457 synthase
MLSQFTKEGNHTTLADLNYSFESDVYPVGRLDADSEGLLLLTNDKRVNYQLLNPVNAHPRSYLIQVEGEITDAAISELERGMDIKIDGKIYRTLPSKAERIKEPDFLPERNPPIRFRKLIPTSWLKLSLIEGKNRQVRKMTAAVGFPTLRLIRHSIHLFSLEKMENGIVEIVPKIEFYSRLGLRM